MKLFSQLSETDQILAIRYATSVVIQDLLEGNLVIEDVAENDSELKKEMDKVLKHLTKIDTEEKKVAYMLKNKVVADAIQEIALEMSKANWYSDDNDAVVNIDELKEEMGEKDDDNADEGNLAEVIDLVQKKASKKDVN
jgi:hypothetical protein